MSNRNIIIEAENSKPGVMQVILGIGGLLAIVAGVLIMVNPLSSAQTVASIVAVFFAIYLIVAGVGFLSGAIFNTAFNGWKRVGYGVIGVLYILGAIFAFGNLTSIALVLVAFLAIIIGITWIVEGIMSFASVKHTGSKIWAIIYGAISVIAGVTLTLWPISGGLALWWLLGLMLIVMGTLQTITALVTRK